MKNVKELIYFLVFHSGRYELDTKNVPELGYLAINSGMKSLQERLGTHNFNVTVTTVPDTNTNIYTAPLLYQVLSVRKGCRLLRQADGVVPKITITGNKEVPPKMWYKINHDGANGIMIDGTFGKDTHITHSQYFKPISSPDDTNELIRNYSTALAYSILYEFEVMQRNIAGATDYATALTAEVTRIENSLIFEQVQNVREINAY